MKPMRNLPTGNVFYLSAGMHIRASLRCRMGVKKGDKLIKRGPVQVVLKEADGKHQLIIRSDDALGKTSLSFVR